MTPHPPKIMNIKKLTAFVSVLSMLLAQPATAQVSQLDLLPPDVQQQLSQFATAAGVDVNLIPFAQVDIVFGPAEGGLTRTISGSYQEGFNVPCASNCSHIELAAPYLGAQWVSGLSQQVRGGYGVLGSLNNGVEPTGRHPFGPAFKVVLLETDEASGTANLGLYFRTCINSPIDLGCSPYFIGPLPFMSIREEGLTAL